jgi:hypothetical protein
MSLDYDLESRENDGDLIWRYMDFTKYVSFLLTARLYIPRADLFHDDPFEGYCPALDITDCEGDPMEIAFLQRLTSYVSCWHRSEHESEAMWKLYLQSSEGVAVAVRTSRLIGQYRKYEGIKQSETGIMSAPFSARFGKVDYVGTPNNETRTQVRWKDLLFYKRIGFKHEEEFRLVIEYVDSRNQPPAFELPVSINDLVEKVVVSPSSQDWFLEVVKRLSNELKLDQSKVEASSLKGAPNWETVRSAAEHSFKKYLEIRAKYPTLYSDMKF